MNNNSTDFTDIEMLKQIVHEETEVKTIKMAQIDDEEAPKLPLEHSLQQRLNDLPATADKTVPLTIFRIPANIRERDKMSYEPHVVSIGPFYRGRENLRAMEENKIYLLRDFLARYNTIDIKVLIEEMSLLEDKARQCYAERIDLNSREFVEMLLLDSCCILENAIKWYNSERDRLNHVRWANYGLLADFLLIENQIPFFVVMKLISLVQPDEKKTAELPDLLVKYVGAFAASKFLGIEPFQINVNSPYEARNLLHLYYQLLMPKRMSYQSIPKNVPAPSTRQRLFSSFKLCICPQPNQGDVNWIGDEPVYVFPCVTELLQSGLIFKPKKSPTDFFDITFQDGIIEMPAVSLDPGTKTTFLNIAAFEQSNGENEFLPFTSYVALMENLVKTSKDVVALRQCGIIYTLDPSEAEAALFFNHAGHVCYLDYTNHYFANLFREIKAYYDSRQKKFKISARA